MPAPPVYASPDEFPHANSIGLTLANEHLASEFKNYVILACDDVGNVVTIDAHVDGQEMLFYMKNQFAAVCHQIRSHNTDDEEEGEP